MISTENITINTQSSVRIEGEKTVYFDPIELTAAAHDADLILVTHDHFDHFDPKSISLIAKEDTVLIAPLSMKKQVLGEAGVPEDRCVFMEPEETTEAAGLAVETVWAYNPNKKFHPKDKKWLGYVVTMDGVRYYTAGDTDMTPENSKVKCDVAFLPVGGKYTMDHGEAAALCAAIKPKIVIPYHYGSYAGKKEDGAAFAAALSDLDPMIKVVMKLFR